ncbi:IS110 family transposase [Pseudovibrio ascidiaceicola]|uniref:IS110 family transposase n=1 Tax=Pseudovibrio ascidiaceicola TaxID=285279 RepID=UPI003D35FB5C
MTLHPFYIGIDISKAYLDIFEESTSKHLQIENTSEAISAWLSAFPDMPSLNIIFEATGRYDRKLTHALHTLKIRFSRVNPARARDFARALGQMAKTDQIDARMLADMGKCLKPDATTQRAPERDQLAALHKRRDELVDTRKKERQRLAQALAEEHASIARHISWLNEEIKFIEQKRDTLLKETAEFTHDNKLLRSIPGVGPITATTLLALMPELGRASPKAIAALAGLAPFNVDSGQFRGHRAIKGGRKRVRNALYMAAVTAARSNSHFASFAQALIKRGKPFKAAMIALARKILITANALLRDGVPFNA